MTFVTPRARSGLARRLWSECVFPVLGGAVRSLLHLAGRTIAVPLQFGPKSDAFDNVDPDIPSQNPNDPNFATYQEYGPAIYDQRNRFVLSGPFVAPWHINLGGVGTLASGLPYNIVTGTNNSGDTGAATDRPVVNGVVLPRNAGRGRSIYDVSPFVERGFPLFSERIALNLRAEAFNVFNHPNFVGYVSTWGNGATAPANLGMPLTGITNQLPARSLQFLATLSF